MRTDAVKGHLDPLLLAVLERGPLHGYGIIDALRTGSGGVFDLPEGTVYPALHRLERSGSVSSRRELINGRERRVYRLSRQGRVTLHERRESWQLFAAAVGHVLGAAPA